MPPSGVMITSSLQDSSHRDESKRTALRHKRIDDHKHKLETGLKALFFPVLRWTAHCLHGNTDFVLKNYTELQFTLGPRISFRIVDLETGCNAVLSLNETSSLL